MRRMAKTHPHAEAVYRVVQLKDMTYGVEVAVPEAQPATITSFATAADAEAWIADHKIKVQDGRPSMRAYRKPFARIG
jgi:hypothetical protein